MSNFLVTGKRGSMHITSMNDASLNAGIFGEGNYILGNGEKLRAEMTSPNNCRLYDGDLVTQGRHSTIDRNTYVDLVITNGVVGMKRNDLVVLRYEKDAETGNESTDFIVIEGTPSATPTDPEYNEGNIFDGDLIVDFPIYRIQLDGISVADPVLLLSDAPTIVDISDYIVERGTSGIWDYEKWASGVAKCWGSRAINNLSVSTPEGSLFRQQITPAVYPTGLFVSVPYVFPIISSTYKVWLAQSGNETASNTGNADVYSATSQTVGINVRYKVVGKWK